ncbi:MAG: AAA family ATPase [Desulfatirhabdiaceae bacterium]
MAVLTISREHQTGCVEIGQAVAHQMGYEFVDKSCIYANLRKTGEKWGRMAEELDEERPSIWEKYDREYRGFISLVESTIYEYAATDRAVILGRGSAFLLHDMPQVLKVRMFAPMDVRIGRLMQKENVDQKTARETLEKIDKSRSGYIQAIYGKQMKDVENYDMLFNTGVQTYQKITENLVKTLEEWHHRGTSESLQRLNDRALAAKLKARIFTHPDLFIPSLEIFHDGQAIVIKGVIHNPEESRLIKELTHEIAPCHSVRNELHYRE